MPKKTELTGCRELTLEEIRELTPQELGSIAGGSWLDRMVQIYFGSSGSPTCPDYACGTQH